MSHIIPIENEDHWHAVRAKHIGASEIQALLIDHEELALCSDDSFVTMNELYWRKRRIKEQQNATSIMKWGNIMEPLIALMIAEENGWTLQKNENYHEHPDHPHLGCTLDYMALETENGPAYLQIKNVVHTSHKWTQTKATPYVEIQVQQELMVANAARRSAGLPEFKYHIIGSMHRGNPEDIRLMFRAANDDVQRAIIDASARFWSDLQSNREPDLNSPKDYAHVMDMIKQAQPVERAVLMKGRPEIDTLAYEYESARQERLNAEKKEQLLKAKLARYCLTEENGKLFALSSVETDKHILTVQLQRRNNKARPASVSTATIFNAKEKK